MQYLLTVGFPLLFVTQLLIVISLLLWSSMSNKIRDKLHCALVVECFVGWVYLAAYGNSCVIYLPLLLFSIYIIIKQTGAEKCQIPLKTGRRCGFRCGLRTVYNSKYCRRHCRIANNTITVPCEQTEESSLQCVICMTNKRNVALQPCHHLAVCAKCIRGVKSCPICRTSIEVIVPIIIS